MFGDGGSTVGANVVLTANNSGYDSSMQASAAQTNQLAQAYDSLKAKIDRGFSHASKASLGISAADLATLTAATVAAGRFQDQMRGLAAQNNVLNQSYGNSAQRMHDYTTAVNQVRSAFGEATGSAAQLVQTISGFEHAGSTQGLTQLAQNFERMSQTTGENASALAQSVLTLGQTMGSTLNQAKAYSDQLVTMADASNTNAESLASFASTLAPLGRQLNMTQSQITGFAAAFSKAGQDGYRASNVFSQMTSDIAQSLQTNSPRLAAYANLLGVTTQALKGMSGASVASGLFDAIGRQGSSALQALNALGYNGLTTTRVVSAVTQQSGGVGNMVRMADGSYGNGAAGAGGQTVSQQFAKLGQDLQMDAEAIGAKFLPALQGVMTLVDKLAAGFTSFMQGPGGEVAAAIGAIVTPLAALVSGLLSLHGVILPLMTLVTLKRSALGAGISDAFRGRQSELGASIVAAPDRKMGNTFYSAGSRIGGVAHGGLGSGRLRYILTGQAQEAAGEEALLGGAAGAGGIGGLRNGVRKVVSWGATAYNTGQESLYGAGRNNYTSRTPLMQGYGLPAAWFGGGSRGATGGAGGVEATIAKFGTRLTGATVSIEEFVAGIDKGAVEAKLVTESDTARVSSAYKVIAAQNAMAEAAAKDAAATTVAADSVMTSARSMAASTAGGALGAVKGVAGGALAIGARTAAVGGEATLGALGSLGPMGIAMMTMLVLPMLLPRLNTLLGTSSGTQGPGPSTIKGTGLSFSLSQVVAPVPVGGATANNLLQPTAAQVFSASQRSDYVNGSVANIQNPTQAATLFGPAWSTMARADQLALQQDLMHKLGPAGFSQFATLVGSGKVSSYASVNPQSLTTMNGGLGALYDYETGSQYGYTNQAGVGLKGLMNTFLSTKQRGSSKQPFDDVGLIPVAGSWLKGLGATAGDASSRGMGTLTHTPSSLGGFAFWGSHQRYGLNGQGMDFATRLFGVAPSGAQQSALGQIMYSNNGLAGMTPEQRLTDILRNLPKADRNTVLAAHDITPSGNVTKDIAAATAAITAITKPMVAALHGLGYTNKQQHEIQNEDSNNPGYYGASMVTRGAGQRRLSQLYLQGGGMFNQTIAAAQAYGQNQLSMLSPFLTPSQQLFGSSTGLPGVSGMNAGMLGTPLGQVNGQFGLLGMAQGAVRTAQGLAATGSLSGDQTATANLTGSVSAVVNAYTSQLQTMKSYEMTMQQLNFSSSQFKESMAWQAQQEKLQVGYQKSDEARSVSRENYSYNLQRKRSLEDFARQRKYAEEDYNIQRSRAMAAFAHQTSQMIKQASISMMDIYKQNPVENLTSAQFLLNNNAQQTTLMNRQESQLTTLRKQGLSTNSIQQLGLDSASNNQQLNNLFGQLEANPALIDQLNQAVQQRLTAAGALATDASSMTYQEQTYQFNLSLNQSAQDFTRSMKHSQTEFDLQMTRSASDFARQMGLQEADFNRQLSRQQTSYDTSVAHSWLTFTQGVANSMAQMNTAAQPLTATAKQLAGVEQYFGKNSAIGQQAAALEKGEPAIVAVLKEMATLLNPSTQKQSTDKVVSSVIGSFVSKFLTVLTNGMKNFGGGTSGGRGPLISGPVSSLLGKGAGPDGGAIPSFVRSNMESMQPESNMCLRDVETAWGAPHIGATALDQWLYGERGHRHPMSRSMPGGVPIWFGTSINPDGHVAINAGRGMMWSEDSDNRWELKPIWSGALGWTDDIAGVQTAEAKGGYAQGSWSLPADQIAQIHKGEMILPAKIASAVRSVVTKSQAAGLRTTAQPVYNTDARSYSTTTSTNYTGDINLSGIQNPAEFANAMKQQNRTHALARG